MNGINAAARAELEAIRVKSGGFLKPIDVVRAARKQKSALHKYFDWDDSSAAEKYRLKQAVQIIQVSVIVSEHTGENVRAFVSLSTERGAKGRGYRASVDVMSDATLFAILLNDAKNELAAFTKKYDRLRTEAQFTGLFDTIQDILEETPKKRGGAKSKRSDVSAAA